MPRDPTLGDDPTLTDLAAALLEGSDVDWASAESGRESRHSSVIRQLRLIAAVVDVHRGSHDAEPEAAREPAEGWWGHLKVLDHIGRGSFGDVYRAWDSRLDREVALKLIRRDSNESAAASASTFIEEGRLLARVRHPNVVTVYGAERIEGRQGIWTEFIHGRTLARIVHDEGPLPVDDAISIGVDVCRALAAVHAAGLLHRDIKPQNVMRGADERVVLMDFGAGGEVLEKRGDDSHPPGLAGTPLYAAPELFGGHPPTRQSDIYSVGVLLCYLLTGQHPVEGTTLQDISDAHTSGLRTHLTQQRSGLSRALLRIVDRALHPEAAQRFESADSMAAALSRARQSMTERIGLGRPRVVAAIVLTAVMLVGLVWYSGFRRAAPDSDAVRPAATAARPATAMIAAVHDEAGDPELANALSDALTKSVPAAFDGPVVLSDRIDALLRLLERSPGHRIDLRLARDLAARDRDVSLIVAGQLSRTAGGYKTLLTVSDAMSGDVLARAEDSHRERTLVTAAVPRLTTVLFSRLAPAARSATVTLEPVTAAREETIRLFSESYRATDGKSAAELIDRALELEPDFAVGHLWKAELLRYGRRPRTEWMPHIERAVALANRTQGWEQRWIHGLHHLVNGRYAEAIPEYAGLLTLRPYDQRLLDDFYRACYEAHTPDTATPYRITAATLRPHDFRLNLTAAEALTTLRGDPSAALTYVQRALAVSGGKDAYPVAWLRFFEAFERWTSGDIDGAIRHVDGVVETFRRGDARARQRGVRAAVWFALAAGQLDRADSYLDELPDSKDSERDKLRVVWMFERGIAADLRKELRNLVATGRDAGPGASLIAWLMARVGQPGEFDETLVPLTRDRRMADELNGELALRAGRPREAIPLLQRAFERERRAGGAMMFLLADSLARALVLTGQRNEAIAILEGAGRDKGRAYPLAWPGGIVGTGWLRTQAALMQLYHDAGRDHDETLLCELLLQHLAASDRDHPLRMQLEYSRRTHRASIKRAGIARR